MQDNPHIHQLHRCRYSDHLRDMSLLECDLQTHTLLLLFEIDQLPMLEASSALLKIHAVRLGLTLWKEVFLD
jgi:hypothetical protein